MRNFHYTSEQERKERREEVHEVMGDLKKIALAMADEYDQQIEELGLEEEQVRLGFPYLFHFLCNALELGYFAELSLHQHCTFLIYNTLIGKETLRKANKQ